MDEQSGSPFKGRLASWSSLTAASTWLRSHTAPKQTSLSGSVLASGFDTSLSSSVLGQLRGMEKQPVSVRNSGTSVDGEVSEGFITPVRAGSQFAPKSRSYTDGVLKRRSRLQTEEDMESIRESVSNLSEEVERQKLATERLQGCVDLHQKFMKDLLQLDCKVTEQELITKKLLEARSQDSVLLDLSLLGLCSLICRTIISWSPFHILLTLVDKDHIKLWLNKCLRLLVSFCLFVLFKSWMRIWGVGERVNQLEAVVYKLFNRLFLPFHSARTEDSPSACGHCQTCKLGTDIDGHKTQRRK